MSFTTWMPPAVSSEAFAWRSQVWRMVESQHIAATMKLVDNRDEQDLLESLLESSKPTQPDDTAGLDYLLATPFRYDPKRGGSRFRVVTDPGVFYGAESVQTAGAELGYWRWKFLKDTVDLDRIEPVTHTAFRVEVATLVVDLQRPPFDADAAIWQQPHRLHTDAAVCAHGTRGRCWWDFVSVGTGPSALVVPGVADAGWLCQTQATCRAADLVSDRITARGDIAARY
ncbi:MAG: RES family NAD+ phosphorylase [Ferrovum myxofaciens]